MRHGKYGAFVACSNYPKCKYVKKDVKDTGIACPTNCGGTLVRKKTKRGKIFYGCSRFPQCKYATWDEPVAEPCPECERPFVLRKNLIKGEPYLYCSDEKCPFKKTVESKKIWENQNTK
jgi:DNA topoisomerase-1